MMSLPNRVDGLSTSQPSEVRATTSGPEKYIAKEGPLRKVKSGHDRYGVLWADDTDNHFPARLEFYGDKRACEKGKTPKRVISVSDMVAVARADVVGIDVDSHGLPRSNSTQASSPGSLTLPSNMPSMKAAEPVYHGFMLILNGAGGDTNVPLACTDPKEHQEWMSLLRDFITKLPNAAAQRLGYGHVHHNLKLCKSDLGIKIRRSNHFPDAPCSFVFNKASVALIRPQQVRPFFTCKISDIRRTGVKDNRMYIHCGRHASHGEGRAYLEAVDAATAEALRAELFQVMVKGASRTLSTSPSLPNGMAVSSAPAEMGQVPSSTAFYMAGPSPPRPSLLRQTSERLPQRKMAGSYPDSYMSQSWRISPTSGKATPQRVTTMGFHGHVAVAAALPQRYENTAMPQRYENTAMPQASGLHIEFMRSTSTPVTVATRNDGKMGFTGSVSSSGSLPPSALSQSMPRSASADVISKPPLPEKHPPKAPSEVEAMPACDQAESKADSQAKAEAEGGNRSEKAQSVFMPPQDYRPRADAISCQSRDSPLFRQLSSRSNSSGPIQQASDPVRRRQISNASLQTLPSSQSSQPYHNVPYVRRCQEADREKRRLRHRSSSMSDLTFIDSASRASRGLSDFSMLDDVSVFSSESGTRASAVSSTTQATARTFPPVELRSNPIEVRSKRQAQLEQVRKLSSEKGDTTAADMGLEHAADTSDVACSAKPSACLEDGEVGAVGRSQTLPSSGSGRSPAGGEGVDKRNPDVQPKEGRSLTLPVNTSVNVSLDAYETMTLKTQPKAPAQASVQESDDVERSLFQPTSQRTGPSLPATTDMASPEREGQYMFMRTKSEHRPPLPKKLGRSASPNTAALKPDHVTTAHADVTSSSSIAPSSSSEDSSSIMQKMRSPVQTNATSSSSSSLEVDRHLMYLKQQSERNLSLDSGSQPNSTTSSYAARSASISSGSSCSFDNCTRCAAARSSSSSNTETPLATTRHSRFDFSGLEKVSATKEKFELFNRSVSGPSLSRQGSSGSSLSSGMVYVRRPLDAGGSGVSGDSLQPLSRHHSSDGAHSSNSPHSHDLTLVADQQQDVVAASGAGESKKFLPPSNSTSSAPISISSRRGSSGSYGSDVLNDNTQSWVMVEPSATNQFVLELTPPVSVAAASSQKGRSPYENAIVRKPSPFSSLPREQQSFRRGCYFGSTTGQESGDEASIDSGFGSRPLKTSKSEGSQTSQDKCPTRDADPDNDSVFYQKLDFKDVPVSKNTPSRSAAPGHVVYHMISPDKTKALQQALLQQSGARSSSS